MVNWKQGDLTYNFAVKL